MLVLSGLLGRDIVDASGRRLGRLADLAIRLDEPYPAVRWLVVRTGRRGERTVIDWDAVGTFEGAGIDLRRAVDELQPVRLTPEELLLARDVLDTQVFDIAGKKLARVGDVRLARDGDRLRVIGVEVGAGAVLRRLGLRRLSGRHRENPLDWKGIHLASGRGHALQLSSSSSGAHRLAPDELVELVARLPTDRAAEILAAVPPELAADALGRARPGLGARVVRALVPKKAGTIVELMASDDAAAALRHLRPAELDKLLAAVDSARAADLRRLLAHPAHTAAGLMNPDVITASSGDDIATIRARLAAGAPLLDALLTVFVVDSDRRLLGVVTPRAQNVGDTRPTPTPSVHQGAPIDEVVGLFALHDILALPVVDDDGHLLGAVAIDDVLEELLAERLPGRRRFRTVRERRR